MDFGDVDPNTGRPSPRTEAQGTVDPLAPSVSNGQISPQAYAEYQAKRRRDALFGTLMTLGGMFGAQPLANAMGVGSAAGGAASGSASVPGAVGATSAPLGGGTVAAGNLAATPFTSLAPYAGSIAGTGTGTGLSAAGAGGGAGIFGGMNIRDLAALGLTGASVAGGALSRPPNMAPNTMTQDPNIQRLLATMQGRMDKSEPLIDSIFSMANGLLPMQYQNGGAGAGAGGGYGPGLNELGNRAAGLPPGTLKTDANFEELLAAARKGGGGMG